MEFAKMEAAGNDFIVFNGIKYEIQEYSKLALNTCDRQSSLGADGILVCENSNKADIKMLYFNSDGSQGEMCGNGIRCLAKYVYEEGIVNKDVIKVETLAGIKTVYLNVVDKEVRNIRVNMGKAIFESKKIPVNIDKEKVIEETIKIDGQNIVFSSVLVGVPHTVIFVDNIKDIDINGLGRKIEINSLFPKKTNVNFIEIVDRENINIYTWERGAGRTLGCGTGSCASVAVGNLIGKLGNKVNVKTEGGELKVEIQKDGQIYMEGKANRIYDGILNMEI